MQWVVTVPWNKGKGDKEADGDMPEFDVKEGLGGNLTDKEKMDIMSREAPRIVHRAHLRKTDFEKAQIHRHLGHSHHECEGQATGAVATAPRKCRRRGSWTGDEAFAFGGD